MEKEIVYLEQGQEAYLVEQFGDKFLVDPIYTTFDYEGEECIEAMSSIVVNKIYSKPPVRKIQEEYDNIYQKLDKKKVELGVIENDVRIADLELSEIKSKKCQLDRMIFDRSELMSAKRITIFTNGYNPVDIGKNVQKNMKLSFEYGVCDGSERAWNYQYYEEHHYGSGDYIDSKYGFLINKTDDEIIEITKKRICELEGKRHDTWKLKFAEDKYLNDELKEKKNSIVKEERAKKIEQQIVTIQKAQEKLKQLTERVKNG